MMYPDIRSRAHAAAAAVLDRTAAREGISPQTLRREIERAMEASDTDARTPEDFLLLLMQELF